MIEQLGLLVEEEGAEKNGFVIKKGNRYMCISSPEFRWLDVISYLPAGCSYSQFLRCLKSKEEKSYFCYQFLDSPEKLDYPCLPPYDSFYSDLKAHNVNT